MEVLSADQLEAIHLTSLRILEELGMEVMSPRVLARLRAGGAEVDRAENSALDRGLVETALKQACSSFDLTPRTRQAPEPRRQSHQLQHGCRTAQRT